MRYYIVDAFTDRLFGGNQAGVCLLDEPVDASLMQDIASENNLAETAFVIKNRTDYYLRWFTPATEIDLCGHATLASAYVISEFVDTAATEFRFHTLSGILPVKKKGNYLEMDFPARPPRPINLSPLMSEALGVPVREALLSRDMVLVLESEEHIRTLAPDMGLIAQLPGCFGVVVTARGDSADFVSRFFAPNAGIPEDPVTGSSHSTLIPFWAERLGKDKMTARQLSRRGGVLYCENCGDRVRIAGQAALYLKGEIMI